MQQKLERLTRLAGSDPGFYVLALHSFVEHWVRDVEKASASEYFRDMLHEYGEELVRRADGAWIDDLRCLSEIGRAHRFTNDVRHAFRALAPEEAVAATHLFTRFCVLAGLADQPPVHALRESTRLWDNRTSIVERSRELEAVHAELAALQSTNSRLLGQLADYEQRQAELARLEHQIGHATFELEQAQTRLKSRNDKVDRLRHERARLRTERDELRKRMEGYQQLERYITSLGRYSVYTRTRLDYERTLMRLTPEQEEAVAAVGTDGDFLIRGGAGTGKSLVLIEALRRRLELGELAFGDADQAPALLLTFNRTLAKFEEYVVAILGVEGVKRMVRTVDAFILERLRRIDPDSQFDFGAVDRIAAELNTTSFLTDHELAVEIEQFLFGHLVTREEYLDEVIPRAGYRRRLARTQREQVWAVRDEALSRMRESGAFSRNAARSVILEYLDHADAAAVARLRDVRHLFVDEAQDLNAADLFTLRRLVTGNLVMAADSDQTIYRAASPFARAGLQLAGRTRVLRTNFRNTRQIHEAATRFSGTPDDELFAFRDGPPPELYRGDSADALQELLVTKLRLLLDHLSYDPENICLLAPHNAEVELLAALLEGEGIDCAVITAREFSFSAVGAVRLSTLHSAKGLDFPVVLLYLPYLKPHGEWDEETTARLSRNLLYVGMTRAMEQLNIFVNPAGEPLFEELCAAVGSGCAEGE